MSVLSSPASELNSPSFNLIGDDLARVGGRIGDNNSRATGHADELLLDDGTAGDDARAIAASQEELLAGITEWDTDRAIQQADEVHAAESRKAWGVVRATLGPMPMIRVDRMIGTRTTIAGAPEAFTTWTIGANCNDRHVFGGGDTPMAAAEDLLQDLTNRYGITPAFGGYRVAGLALILGGHDRKREEAYQFAYRVAIDPTYFDELLRLGLPGIVDERSTQDRPTPAASELPAVIVTAAA